MANQRVKLLGCWVSPFSRRVEWTLKLKGIDYEYIEEDIFNKSSLLLQLNPLHKKVPVFIDGPNVILESLHILEYIDESWSQNPLLPRDAYERAAARFWVKSVEDKLMEASWKMMIMQYKGEEKETASREAIQVLEKMEEELQGKKFFGGNEIGYLDIGVGWVSYWLPVWEEVGSIKLLDELKFPAMAGWIKSFLDHPVVNQSLPLRDDMLAYFNWRSRQYASKSHH